MKKLAIILICMVVLASCDDSKTLKPLSTFDTPFPKRNKDLSLILGDQLTIKTATDDTLILKIISNQNNNLIINSETGDTVFFGTVSKFRGLYYFSEQLNDSSYWIYAVKIAEPLIYGLTSKWMQLFYVDEAIKKGSNKKLVKYINADTSTIKLYSDKRELKKLFSSFIDKIQPDTIIHYLNTVPVTEGSTNIIAAIDPEDFNYISKAYPNPTSGIITIELQQKNKSEYQLSDFNGAIILEGTFNEISNKMDLSKQQPGMYTLTILNVSDQQKETIKIMKTE
ncbi:MAG: T9SS type A sorting domain-containing protein [Bacteroidota bacterium]|nr:T9SS type A sorting domain-containing protein [Bacteroidota bacterium]